MPTSATIETRLTDSAAAGRALAAELHTALGAEPADAIILFAAPQHDLPALLSALQEGARPKLLVGGTSAGEMTSRGHGTGGACAIAIRSPRLRLSAAVGRGLRADREGAVAAAVEGLAGLRGAPGAHRSAMVLADATAGGMDAVVEALTRRTGGDYAFFGGGVGGDDGFQLTRVLYGTSDRPAEAIPDALLVVEILSDDPIGIGIAHGWTPAIAPMRVTEAVGTRLYGLDGAPANEAYRDFAASIGRRFDDADPLPFFLHHILGVETTQGWRLRVPLAVHADGSIECATEVPVGAKVAIMTTSAASAADAASLATSRALERIGGRHAGAALMFDCVATRLRLGHELGTELAAVQRLLGSAPIVGCNTIGQIARAEGQFGGFHNCTAVVAVIPD